VAIANSRLLKTNEFIRRFLIHVLPSGFHRIRHYGLLANARRAENIKRARALLIGLENREDKVASEHTKSSQDEVVEQAQSNYTCPDCGNPMVIIECFERGRLPRAPPKRTIAA
jgi:peptide subunit release factor 1 (eRF1)